MQSGLFFKEKLLAARPLAKSGIEIWYLYERSQNTVLLASTQAVYKALHSTVRESQTHTVSHGTDIRAAVAVAVGSLRA